MNLYYIFRLNIIIRKGLMEKYPARMMWRNQQTGIRIKKSSSIFIHEMQTGGK